ncbi:MAG: DNA-processing protein DprA [Patescibacteria group bacterium]
MQEINPHTITNDKKTDGGHRLFGVGVKIVKIADENYPETLKKIPDAPKVLYYQGNLIKDEKCIAVVGTRRPSPYGQQVTLQITGELAEAGLTIVSGMAPGIDTFAHKICIEKKKRTIAVLGTGLDEKSIYPQENLQLSRKIIENGGCLISEFPLGTHGSKFTFPKRNRIISALSLGVLIVEAKEKSGSLITAEYAKKQNKKVFAVPGQIFSSNSKGPNKLIKDGAILVENSNDILENIAELRGILPACAKAMAGRRGTTPKEFSTQNPEENLILQTLKEEALYIDKIIEKTKLSAPVVGSTLALMEISGKIRNLGGNIYSLKECRIRTIIN